MPGVGVAQPDAGVVPITAEPHHRIRFDNGNVRMYEVVLRPGEATRMHEHRADSFGIYFSDAETTIEPHGGGAPEVYAKTAGSAAFTSTAKGPYSHRVIDSGDTTFHVIAVELLAARPAVAPPRVGRPGTAFKLLLESPRGCAYRLTLAPGESTKPFIRPPGSALFAVSAGRISESIDGSSLRLWDFEPADFRWFDDGATVVIRNEGPAAVDLVEVDVE